MKADKDVQSDARTRTRSPGFTFSSVRASAAPAWSRLLTPTHTHAPSHVPRAKPCASSASHGRSLSLSYVLEKKFSEPLAELSVLSWRRCENQAAQATPRDRPPSETGTHHCVHVYGLYTCMSLRDPLPHTQDKRPGTSALPGVRCNGISHD